MKRSIILQIPLVTLAAILAGTLSLVFWLIMLIPFLIKPSLTRPFTMRISQAFTKQVISYLIGGTKSTPQQSPHSESLSLLFLPRSPVQSSPSAPKAQQTPQKPPQT